MLRLNDDCLLEIFRQLTLREQIVLTTVCERFRDVIVSLIWRPAFREVRTDSAALKTLMRADYETVISSLAEDLEEKLTIVDTVRDAFTSYLGRYDLRPALVFYLRLHFPRLRALDIEDSSLHDSYMRLVVLCFPALRMLRVTSTYITGKHIKKIRQLRQLYMPKCSLSADNLSEILAADGDERLMLTELDISENAAASPTVDEALKQTLAAKLRNLQHLEVLVLSPQTIDGHVLQQLGAMRNFRRLLVIGPFEEKFETLLSAQFYPVYGAHIDELRIANTMDNIGTFQIIFPFNALNLRLLSSLRIVHLEGYFPSDILRGFQAVETLRELHVRHIGVLPSLSEFVRNCKQLEHIHLKRLPLQLSDLMNWLDESIEDLQQRRQIATTCPLLITIYAGTRAQEVTQLISWRQQNIFKFKVMSDAAANVSEETATRQQPYIEFGFTKNAFCNGLGIK